MAVYLHAALQIIGHKGYEFLIDEGVRKTSYLAKAITSHPEFELLNEPEMNILIYRHVPEGLRAALSKGQLTEADNEAINGHNVRLQKAQRQAGQFFVSRTTLNIMRCGKPMPTVALRAVLANPLTAEKDIDAVLSDQVRIAAGLHP
jgi:glutamate decarboxylase